MKVLKPEFYQHKVNLMKNIVTVQQRRYQLNPKYIAKEKKEINKLLRVGFIWLVERAT